MSFDLHSRVVRIGGPELAPGCGYRDITIHEMTEHEIHWLKSSRWQFALMAFAIGFTAGSIFTIITGPYPKF